MQKWTKVLMTAGAVGALGVAGTAGTFASFTDSQAGSAEISSGTLKTKLDLNLGDLRNFGTTSTDGLTSDVRDGSIAITNNGSRPQNVYVDFDGPVGNLTPNGNSAVSDDPLAENVEVTTSYNANFTPAGDDKTRLWVVNNRGLFALPSPSGNGKLVLNPGQGIVLYTRIDLRELYGNDRSHDNTLQGLSANETVTVKGIEAGGDDFGPTTADHGE